VTYGKQRQQSGRGWVELDIVMAVRPSINSAGHRSGAALSLPQRPSWFRTQQAKQPRRNIL